MSTAKESQNDLGFPANGSRQLQEQLDSSTMRTYQSLDKTMHELHLDKTNEKGREEAEKIAHTLLSNADLPLVFRCRALMILGCSAEPGYVEHAREALRFAELGMANAQAPTEADHKLLADCKLVLKQAEEDFEEHGGYADGDEDEDEEA